MADNIQAETSQEPIKDVVATAAPPDGSERDTGQEKMDIDEEANSKIIQDQKDPEDVTTRATQAEEDDKKKMEDNESENTTVEIEASSKISESLSTETTTIETEASNKISESLSKESNADNDEKMDCTEAQDEQNIGKGIQNDEDKQSPRNKNENEADEDKNDKEPEKDVDMNEAIEMAESSKNIDETDRSVDEEAEKDVQMSETTEKAESPKSIDQTERIVDKNDLEKAEDENNENTEIARISKSTVEEKDKEAVETEKAEDEKGIDKNTEIAETSKSTDEGNDNEAVEIEKDTTQTVLIDDEVLEAEKTVPIAESTEKAGPSKNIDESGGDADSNDKEVAAIAKDVDMDLTGDDDETNETTEQASDNAMNSIENVLIEEEPSNYQSRAGCSHMDDENSIFVQVNNDDSKDDGEKSNNDVEQVTNEVDPIGSSEWNQSAEVSDNTFVSDLDEADECIIPDAGNKDDMESATASTPLIATPIETNDSGLDEKYLVSVATTEEELDCMMCQEKKATKYNCIKANDKTSLCSEECLTKLKEKHTDNVIVRKLRVRNFRTDLQGTSYANTSTSTTDVAVIGNLNCKSCGILIENIDNSLSWEAFDFCNEQCLTKYQKAIGSFCANCRIAVKENFLGKYCVRFGYNVRQFCSSTCLEQYKKNSKVCSFCQDDISSNRIGFVTSIAEKGMAKDFCSAHCMHKYGEINKNLKGPKTIAKCSVCHKTDKVEIEFDNKNRRKSFCSHPCFVAHNYVYGVTPIKCDMCFKYYVPTPPSNISVIRYDGILRRFCEKTCQNIYITTNRKIVSCCWCKVKKYNFDMIQKYTPDNTVVIICSLTCLSFFNASINAQFKKKRCNFCHKLCKGQFHITIADDSMKNFCSYPCVSKYQNKYITAPARFIEQPNAVPTTSTSRVTRKTTAIQQKQIIPDVPGPLPIITSVRSLAPGAKQSSITRSLRSKSSTPSVATITTIQPQAPTIRRLVLVRPADLPVQKNVMTMAKPINVDAETEIKPEMVDKAIQTEDIKDSLVLLPVPVPIYVPAPLHSLNLSYPVPMPFPLPIPIPILVPLTKQTAAVVLKEKKKLPIKTDPYEEDLLMMAELVAGEIEKKEPAQSEGEGESDGDHNEPAFSPEQPEPHNAFGDDMLQIALKMATDFEEPAVDLEGALTATTITAMTGSGNDDADEPAPMEAPIERSPYRGRRRGRPARQGGRRRGRGRPPAQPQAERHPEPQPPPEPVEKPDANMCLKYTFGVNAWKQWVTTKNAELEKSSRRAKQFKADLLQLTSDELNYSLCLFVKEVRKPNGAEYAPDTIYYLCLGIQQYLFENGRIDNIFCDSYYESFTDCLDEVCKKFSTLYSDSQYIVTRVEEEHLWECKQLGAHSPHVLLSTLIFFNTKHFNLTNVDEHMQLSFSHIMKHWKRVWTGQNKNAPSRNIILRFYPPQSALEGNNRKKKLYEQQENEENPLRCPVKLYEFFLSKCPESVKSRNDVFYLLPERSCVPDSPVWFSTMALGKEALEKMLHRVKMVKEINVALLAS